MLIDPSILLASRVLGAFVFASAVIGKLRHRDEFIGVVANYRIVPPMLVAPAAWLVIALEIIAALSLISGIALRGGATISLLLLCAFTTAVAINLGRGRTDIDCGCFQSALRQHLSGALVLRNVLLVVALLPLAIAHAPLPASLLEAVDGLAAGAVLSVLYQVFGHLIALRDSAKSMQKRLI